MLTFAAIALLLFGMAALELEEGGIGLACLLIGVACIGIAY